MSERNEERGYQPPTHHDSTTHYRESWFDRPHEELVAAFSAYIDRTREEQVDKRKQNGWSRVPSRVSVVLDRLQYENAYSENPVERKRIDFFKPIYNAWQLVSYDQQDRWEKHHSSWHLSLRYERSKEERPALIRLTDPLQVRILDALAEAVGVPHQRGQAEFEMPEHIRTYNKWLAKELAKQRGG